MPRLPPRPCTKPGCRAYSVKDGRCADHQKQPHEMDRKPWADRGTGSSRGYGWKWAELRVKILRRDGYLCQPCQRAGRLTKATQVDHIKPKCLGGDDSRDNLEAICTTCHNEKTAKESRQGGRGRGKSGQ